MNKLSKSALVWVVSAAAAACSIRAGNHEVGVYTAPDDVAEAGTTGTAGNAGEGGAASLPPAATPAQFLAMCIRDFKLFDAQDPTTNPDFDNFDVGASEKSVVTSLLGEDGKPVYMPPNNALPTFGQAAFDQWYRNLVGTNFALVYPLPLTLTSDGQYEYDSQKSGTPDFYQNVHRRIFAPIDDDSPNPTPFGNQGKSHNFAFTGELHASFTLTDSGGTLQVRADDDLYVFVDGKLTIDLGGNHGPVPGEVALGGLGLTVGQAYPLDIFYAERMGATGDLMLRTDVALGLPEKRYLECVSPQP